MSLPSPCVILKAIRAGVCWVWLVRLVVETNGKLDVPFTAEEVEHALSRLKRRKAAGPEGLMVEHLQEAGSEVQVWLRSVLDR